MADLALISRDEAIDTLNDIADSGILKDEYESSIREIVSCLMAENEGRHEWGANPNEIIELFVARDIWTDEEIKKAVEIDAKHRFVPSKFEEEELIARNVERLEYIGYFEDETEEEKIEEVKKRLRISVE